MMRRMVSGLLTGALAISLAGCGPSDSGETRAAAAQSGPPRVLTTFYPTTYFAERIAGDLLGGEIEVVCPVPADADPIFWQPTAEQVGEYQEADLIVLNGAGFERWAANAALPTGRTVDSAAGFAAEFIAIEGKTHSHGPAGAHTHEGLDGHTWLDPINAVAQSQAVAGAMAGLLPEHGEALLDNAQSLEADLRGLDAACRALTPLLGSVRVLASHPAYNYISRRYGWGVTSFDLDPGGAITPDQLTAIEAARNGAADGLAVMLWESEPGADSIVSLEAIGVVSVVFSPAEMVDPARLAAGEDYLSIMHANIERLRDAVSP